MFFISAGFGTFERLPGTYLLLGLDFIVTSDYHVWFIEVNNTPLWPTVNSYNMAVSSKNLIVHFMDILHHRMTCWIW